MYSSGYGSGSSGMLVASSILFVINMALIVHVISEMAPPPELYVLLMVEGDGLDVRVEANPVNDAVLPVNRSSVPFASYNGSIDCLEGWAGNIIMRFSSRIKYTLLDYLEGYNLVRP